TADIVVKPISQFLKSIGIFSGATIMGDGSVSLILDVMGIAQKANLEKSNKESDLERRDKAISNVVQSSMDAQEFLIFRVNAPGKYAVPLCLVSRLEEFSLDQIEFSGNQRVVRYRDGILPIISLNHELGFVGNAREVAPENEHTLKVIVTEKQAMMFGIEVNNIEDVVLIEGKVDEGMKDRDGIMGNIISGEEIIVIADVLKILDNVIRRITKHKSELVSNLQEQVKGHPSQKILIAEDTAFFRVRMKNLLEKAGYKVDVAVNGKEALAVLDQSTEGSYDLILSDIEMPQMNGIEFAKEV
ncbi:MAG: chemotaxis protein CheW, partial [Bdellovibrionales bacterium]|nr:chemotaxis protein CheW [Bdellovibrionales bacterium]